ncbi:hypothetical protein LTR84_007617 [Exophiala bonariae]|uniref:Carboxylesterase type B domain-containing protein n=1 Tax=Exophiala bonariae TaxID=1690606 RepID=A0AAV9NKK6_9EURO|nr:hypothetical protein LTR84_007617 [Exophiala bonariae]
MADPTIEHPLLGSILGVKKSEEVVQFLGIQYATLKDRFSRGVLLRSLTRMPGNNVASVFDATKSGPIPLNPPNACALEQSIFVQKSIPFTPCEQSDTEGLTLNISVPAVVRNSNGLPVFTFVHGGGWVTGSTVYPQYDLAAITRLSVEAGMPMISVGISYRTGAAGFMHSSVMAQHGYLPNNGLDDQRLAFRWIKQHISGFGGDPNRVTFVGESAGAVAGWLHLQSSESLFSQMVSMSGSSFIQPRPMVMLEKSFSLAAAAFGAEDVSPDAKLQKLLEAPQSDLAAQVLPVGPLFDGDLIRKITRFNELLEPHDFEDSFPAMLHCKKLVMGDCQMDGMGFYTRVKTRTDVLPQALAESLGMEFDRTDPSITLGMLAAYGLDADASCNTQETTRSVVQLLADVLFSLPSRYLAQAWATSPRPGVKAYLYHFNCPNPWEGPWQGHATHALDIMFVLQNYAQYLDKGQEECALRFSKDLISFVNGNDPWPACEPGGQSNAMVYYAPMEGDLDQSKYVVDGNPASTGRKNDLVELVGEERLDKLVEACQHFLIGPHK